MDYHNTIFAPSPTFFTVERPKGRSAVEGEGALPIMSVFRAMFA